MDLHLFEQGGENLLYFPRSAKLYQLSDPAARILPYLADGGALSSPPITPAPLPHPFAADHGPLVDDLRYLLHEEAQISPATPLLEEPSPPNSFHTFSIYVAQSCNMSCCYCWSQGGSFGKAGHLMEEAEVPGITTLIASLVRGADAGEEIWINFYGGEPLLNFPVLRKMSLALLDLEQRSGRSFHFTIDTNGSLMHGEAAEFLGRYFSHVAVSLDGREEVHDLQRPGKCGERTWRNIVKNIREFSNRDILGLRATLTPFSDSYLETFGQLASLGVRRLQLEYCHEPGYHTTRRYRNMIVPLERQAREIREFLDDYVDAISRYRTRSEIPFISNLLDHVTRLTGRNRTLSPCGAGTNTLAISSRGVIYPCVAFVGQEPFKMAQEGTRCVFANRSGSTGFDAPAESPCDTCWLRYDCAGGCYATHYDASGSSRTPAQEYCQGMRAKTEVYLYALARMQKKCPWHLNSDLSPPLPEEGRG